MSDLQATGSNPGTEYLPAIGPPTAPYNEDRQVTLSGGPGTQMYRTLNAYFDQTSGIWMPVTSAPAYSTVQNPDGSIHYYTLNSEGTWSGSGNNTVFNAVDYGLVQGVGQSAATRAANVAAIQSAIDAAIALIPAKANGGGTVVIPAGVYELGGTLDPEMAATISVANVTGGLVIRGESAGTTLVQYGTPPSDSGINTLADIFDVSNAGNPAQFGVRFRDLTLQYAPSLIVPTAGACAINCLSGTAYVTAESCGFYDCPQAFAAAPGNSGGVHCGLFDCVVFQDVGGYPDSTQVLLSAPEAFVINTDILQGANGTPANCVGIAVHDGAEGCRIYGCHISYLATGIWVKGGANFTYITDCELDGTLGIMIAPESEGETIYGVYVTACKVGLKNYTPPVASSGIFIDTTGGQNSNVEGVFLSDCLVYGYQNAGVQINQGQSISVIGGKYSSNGWDPYPTIAGAGIAITGPCSQVRITGADCSGIFDFLGPSPPAQPYGVAVEFGATDILVADCDLTGNDTKPIYVPTGGTDLRVINCLGYNDQGTLLTAPIPSVTFYNYTFNDYYGPITFYLSGGESTNRVTIGPLNTGLATGAFYLPCKVGASVAYSGIAPTFGVVGM
jgi:hypothetical protein